jgi:hypothetical protein
MLTGMSFFVFALGSAHAQFRLLPHFRQDCCEPHAAPAPTTAPPTTDPTRPMTPMTPPELDIMPGARATAALGDTAAIFGPGYLDNAIPFSHFRLRFDAAYDNNRPDRAEYFYAKCGCFRFVPPSQGGDPDAPGPILPETSVDYQDIAAYLEIAGGRRASAFIEFPFRFLNPELNSNTAGLADMNIGFKYAFVSNDCRVVTFQGRVYLPTGPSERGLGTDHVSIEPSLLYAGFVSDRLTLFGQFGIWIPIDGTDFAGEILRYGAGLQYLAIDSGRVTVSPVIEVLGWTVLDGKALAFPENVVLDASGDTIVNAKFGVRFGLGGDNCGSRGLLGRPDLYVGYGRCLTGDRWYQDIVRLELRIPF